MPGTVTGAVRLSVTDGPMRLVLLLTAVGGVGLVACELLGPVRFADLAGGRDGGAAVYGMVLAVSFAAAAVGAMAAPALRRLLRGSTRVTCALLFALGAAGLAVVAGPDVLLVAAAGFAVYYLAHGSTWPLLSAVLHTRVDAAHRATAVSAMSLAQALGGIIGNLAVPPLAAALEHRRGLLRRRRRRPARVRWPACGCRGRRSRSPRTRRISPLACLSSRNARDTRSH